MEKCGNLYFGDIHNHNGLGYGVGSLERSLEIARGHLDFYAFTGHSSWHDIEPMEGGREAHWHKGFEKHNRNWGKIQEQMAQANRPGEFVSILGFEWHSSRYGDHCILFPGDNKPLVAPATIEALRAFCREHEALMIPHHLAYPTGRRGVNWEVFDSSCSPIVEIFSEHGNSEEDRGDYSFFNHSFGGRITENTVRYALDRGLRFGFFASTDSHRGFPGAYGEGLMGAWADGLDRGSIFQAFRDRRTYGLTGDRIEVEFWVNEEFMGGELESPEELRVGYKVSGRDDLDVVDIIHNGRVVHRDYVREDASGGETEQIRLEWGWGPWGDLALDRVCDWEFSLGVSGASVSRFFPHWQSGPFDEDRRHRIERVEENRFEVTSYTSRKGAYRQNPNQSLVLECSVVAEGEVEVELRRPVAERFRVPLEKLRESGQFLPTGPFPKESLLLHRAVPEALSRLEGRVVLKRGDDGPGYVYLRVRQKNGQYAWASPVFYT